MHTPCFPTFRSRLAALGRHTAKTIRQATLGQLQEHLRHLLPAPLLSATDEGANSRERIFSLRLTFECFVWQLLTPRTSCRSVRHVQTLFRLGGRGWIDENNSACVQARQRWPRACLEKASSRPPRPPTNASARSASSRAGRSKWSMPPPPNCRITRKTRNATLSPPPRRKAVGFRR